MATFQEVTGSETGGSNVMTFDWPPTVNANDFMVMSVSKEKLSTNPDAISNSGGWIELVAIELDFAQNQWLFYKIADGSESGTFTVTFTSGESGRGCCQVARYTGANAVDVTGTTEQSFSTTHVSPAITTSADNQQCGIFLSVTQPDNPLTVTAPESPAESINSGPFTAMSFTRYEQVSAGSTGTKSWTDLADSDQTHSIHYSITNSAGGGPSPSVGRLINGGLINGGLTG